MNRRLWQIVTPLFLTVACSSNTGGGAKPSAPMSEGASPPTAPAQTVPGGGVTPAPSGGVTLPTNTTSAIGGACKTVADCASPANVCADDPGGQCQKDDCVVDADCGDVTKNVCARIDDATMKGVCYPRCNDIAANDCARKAEGYTCQTDEGNKVFCDAGPFIGDSCSRPGDPLTIKCAFGLVCSSDPAPAQACQNDVAGGKACHTDADCAAYGPGPYVCTNGGTCYKPCADVLANDCERKADGMVCQLDTGLTGTAYCDAGNPTYEIHLDALAVSPPCGAADTGATGTVTISVDAAAKTVSVTDFTYSSLSGAPTMVHIHANKTMAMNGPHVLDLEVPAGAGATGSIPDRMLGAADFIPDTSATPVGPTTFDELIVAIEKGYAYVNVHTAACGSGEIGGQISKK